PPGATEPDLGNRAVDGLRAVPPVGQRRTVGAARLSSPGDFPTLVSVYNRPTTSCSLSEAPLFVAWRDLRFARGRFTLITAVVLLITLLVGFLGGLTQGLANANISAILPFRADAVVLAEPAEGDTLSFTDSRITEEAAAPWRAASGTEL